MQAATTSCVRSPGGRPRARRVLAVTCLLAPLCLAGITPATANPTNPDPIITVHEAEGVFTVSARFHVPQAPAAVLAVLTDYEAIPRVMPDVTRSVVLSRSADHVVVEQEAVSKVLFFSKTVKLVLDVREGAHDLRFRDVGGESFELYEGAWHVRRHGNATVVTYQLRARPAFEVPDFLVKRLFRRDAGQLIARLRQAIGG